MASAASKKVVVAALFGNGLIAITKFIASFISGSTAMMSEAIHSVVDTGNQGLLLFGMKRATKPADDQHPFGYGMELYFWSFVVAILIFAVGAGVSIVEGVEKIMHPHELHKPYINYIVLGFAMIFEGVAWWIAFKEFNRLRNDDGVVEALQQSKNPTIFTVLMEDSAAMLGLFVAFIGVFISHVFHMPVFDGIASVMIGIILALTAAFLAYESKGLLIGEGADPKTVDAIRSKANNHPDIASINEILTMHFGPDDILLNLSLDFPNKLTAAQVEDAISELEKDIKKDFPEMKRIFIEAQSLQGHLKDKNTHA